MPEQIVLVDLNLSSNKITNVGNGVADTDAPNMGQLRSAIEGISWKDNCRAASTVNVTLSNPGTAVFDGITLVANDRILLKNQTAQAENGIYVFNSSSTALTRALDANTFDELESAAVSIDEGTVSAGVTYRQTQVNGVIGTNNVVWTSFGQSAAVASETVPGVAEIATQAEMDAGVDDVRMATPAKVAASPYARKSFNQTFGDGSATSFTITHNLNTQDVNVRVREMTGSLRDVICEVRRTTVNTVTLLFNVAPAASALRVTVNKES